MPGVGEGGKRRQGARELALGTSEVIDHYSDGVSDCSLKKSVRDALARFRARSRRHKYRAKLWRLQRAMWKVTEDDTLRGCGRYRAGHVSHVGLAWRGSEQGASFAGLQSSHSVWASPVASAAISKQRQVEVAQALDTWVQDYGHSAVFLTLTVRHTADQPLRLLWDAVATGWHRVASGAAWHGGKCTLGDVERFGIRHFIRTVEVTHGKHGWHPHMHAVLLVDKRLSKGEISALRDRIYTRWSKGVASCGLDAPSPDWGINLQPVGEGSEFKALASYMTKGHFGDFALDEEDVKRRSERAAWELTGGQMLKRARQGNRTPFQILAEIAENGVTERDRQLWLEWEKSSKRRRQIAWSEGCREEVGVRATTDEEAEVSAGGSSGDQGAVDQHFMVARIPADEWERIASDVELRCTVTEYVSRSRSAQDAGRRAAVILARLGVTFEPCCVPFKAGGECEALRLFDGVAFCG